MRKALVVGIDHYIGTSNLYGCVNDAYSIKAPLERHSDGTVNFSVALLTGTGPNEPVTRAELRQMLVSLFADDTEVALFYFAGHGHVDKTGGYLVTSDAATPDAGLAFSELVTLAHESRARNRIIVLDTCHSGAAGDDPLQPDTAKLRDGTTILTAATAAQYATEENGSGVFTSLFVDALNGAGANLVGAVTPGSVYAHIDQSLGPWDQRPVFKTNVTRFISLRKVQAPIPLADLQRITEFFPTPGFAFQLDPSFEPEREEGSTLPPPIPMNTAVFAILQKYNRVNLLTPEDAPHMWHAAIHSKSCRLTVLGEHYRRLVERKRI